MKTETSMAIKTSRNVILPEDEGRRPSYRLIAVLTGALSVILCASACTGAPRAAGTTPEAAPEKASYRPPSQEPDAQARRIQDMEKAAALLEKGDTAAAEDTLARLAAASPGDTNVELARSAVLVSAGTSSRKPGKMSMPYSPLRPPTSTH
jgi:hypothetical protein